MKRVSVIAILLCFLVPVVVSAADTGKRDMLKFGDAQWISKSEITVPVSVLNSENLVAMDIPLRWPDGVTLTDVSFANTRVDYFDIKIANIDEATNQVLIGLISMVYERKEDLKPGDGIIAEMTFRIDDMNIEDFEITSFETKNPGHSLSFVYNDWTTGRPIVAHTNPGMEGATITLKGGGPNPTPLIPVEYSLDQNFPNPFNPSTTLAYSLKDPGHVTLNIYNVLGQNVRILVDEYQDAGRYTTIWDGHDDRGNVVASGMYFYRIKSGDFTEIKKMVMVK
jgi:hypothetical protein